MGVRDGVVIPSNDQGALKQTWHKQRQRPSLGGEWKQLRVYR
jgi:hypothetical protein